MQNKQSGFGIVEVLILVVIAGLVGALGYLAYTNYSAKKDSGDTMFATTQMPPLVRGVVGPNVSNASEYIKASGLSDALNEIAKDNPCAATEGRFKQIVLGVTEDKTQALIGNSCGSTGILRTFMVKEGEQWKVVGIWKDEMSRKDFSSLTDTPSCELVTAHNIQRSIAPICFEIQEGTNSLAAGDLNRYQFVVR